MEEEIVNPFNSLLQYTPKYSEVIKDAQVWAKIIFDYVQSNEQFKKSILVGTIITLADQIQTYIEKDPLKLSSLFFLTFLIIKKMNQKQCKASIAMVSQIVNKALEAKNLPIETSKYIMKIITYLLHFEVNSELIENALSKDLLQIILDFSYHKSKILRTHASKSIATLFENQRMFKIAGTMKFIEDFIMNQLKSKYIDKVINLLHFLGMSLMFFPSSTSTLIVGEIVYQIKSKTIPDVTIALLVLSTYISSKKVEKNVLENIHAEVMKNILENEWSNQSLVAGIQCIAHCVKKLMNTDENEDLSVVVTYISLMCDYLLHTDKNIAKSTYYCFLLVISHISPITKNVDNFEQMNLEGDQQFLPSKLISVISYLLSSRFIPARKKAFKIINKFIETCGKRFKANLNELVQTIASNYCESRDFNECIGSIIKNLGIDYTLELLPLKLFETDLNSLLYTKESCCYILQLMPKYMGQNPLKSFLEKINVQINILHEQIDNEESELRVKKYEHLLLQCWSILPPLIANLTDLKGLEKLIETMVKNLSSSKEITTCIIESFIELSKKLNNNSNLIEVMEKNNIINFLKSKFESHFVKLFLIEQEQNPSTNYGKLIKSVALIMKGDLMNKLADKYINSISISKAENLTGNEIKNSLALLNWLIHGINDNEVLKRLIEISKNCVNDHSNSKIGYRLLTHIIKNSNMRNLDEIENSLNCFLSLLPDSPKKCRIDVIITILDKLKRIQENPLKIISKLVPEIILISIDINKKAVMKAKVAISDISKLLIDRQIFDQLLLLIQAGLAAKTDEFIAGTLKCLNWIYKDKEIITDSMIFENIIPSIFNLIKEKSKMVGKQVLKFIKAYISHILSSDFNNKIKSIITTVFESGREHANNFQKLSRSILAKPIKKSSAETIKKESPSNIYSLIEYVRKELKYQKKLKKKNKKAEQKKNSISKINKINKSIDEDKQASKNNSNEISDSDDSEVDSTLNNNRHFQQESDSDEEIPIISKQEDNIKEEKASIIHDLFENLEYKTFFEKKRENIVKSKKDTHKRQYPELYQDKESGKLVINEENFDGDQDDQDSENDEENHTKNLKKKKLIEGKEESTPSKIKSRKRKKNNRVSHNIKESGKKFKNKKGSGDVYRKTDKFEPYAYIELNPKMASKRHKKIALKTFEKYTKKSGLLKGLEFSKH